MSDKIEKMWVEFEDWWMNHVGDVGCREYWFEKTLNGELLRMSTRAAFAAYQHRQHEIDALQARIAELEASRGVVVLPDEPDGWMHSIVHTDGEYTEENPDYALSFSPDSFPLSDTGMFRSIKHVPVHALTDATTITAAELDELRNVVAEIKPHIAAWRCALTAAYQMAIRELPDRDNKAYWQHEINALDKIDAAMSGQDAAGSE